MLDALTTGSTVSKALPYVLVSDAAHVECKSKHEEVIKYLLPRLMPPRSSRAASKKSRASNGEQLTLRARSS